MLTQMLLKEKSKKEKLKNVVKSYEESFTIHGLSKIFTGTRTECIMWSIALLCSFFCIVYFTYSLATKYRKREVYESVQKKLVRQNFLPSITFCVNREILKEYCKLKFQGYPFRTNFCNWKGTYPMGKISASANSIRSKVWDQYLQIGCSSHVDDCNVNDVFHGFLKWQNYSRANCATWNYKGTFYKDQIELEIGLGSATSFQKYIEMILHHHDEYPFLKKSGIIRISPGHDYQIMLSKTRVKRLPAPMKSKCVNTTQDFIFPGKYTTYNCQESVICMKALKFCGDTYDHCKDYITSEMLAKYHNESRDIMEVWECLKQNEKSFIADSEDCPPPCEEISYESETSLYQKRGHDGNSISIISFEYKHEYTYLYSEEKEVYGFHEFLGATGGFFGLVAGMSLLSFVEVLIFFVLRIAHKYA